MFRSFRCFAREYELLVEAAMPLDRKLVALSFLALSLLACGGTITSGTPDASTGQGGAGGSRAACSTLSECDCYRAGDRCAPRTEACWCPDACAPIECICGGGRFLACEDYTVVASCVAALTAVETKCAGQSFVQYIDTICRSASNPTCVAGCLANLAATGSCAEVDCGFCPVCDCASFTTPNPFRACLATCAPPLPEGAPR